jgi:RNA polymerase sigma-70 factor (ECF subfamily)
LLDEEAQKVLALAMEGLPPDQRAVLTLRVVEEMSYKEIAETLALTPGTVMSRLFRARERLADALAPYLGGRARLQGEGA